MKAPSANNKEYIVMLLKPDLPSASETSLDKKSGDFSEGYFVIPKSKRSLEEEYCGSVSHRKGSGVINIKLPYHGAAAGVSYEVRGIDKKELLCICNCKIKIDQVGLLEDVSSAAFSKTVQQLLVLKSDEKKYPQALDPVKGINIIIGALGQMNCMVHFVSLSHPFEFVGLYSSVHHLTGNNEVEKLNNIFLSQVFSVPQIQRLLLWGAISILSCASVG